MVDVNLRAVLHLCRLLLPGMVERDRGHVVNISSIAGLYNFYGHTAYHATKAAVHQISRQLRNDVIGKRIRVTEICPGRVETEIFGRNLGGTPEALQEAWHTYYEGFESITTADIADTIEFALDAPAPRQPRPDRDPADLPGARRPGVRPPHRLRSPPCSSPPPVYRPSASRRAPRPPSASATCAPPGAPSSTSPSASPTSTPPTTSRRPPWPP